MIEEFRMLKLATRTCQRIPDWSSVDCVGTIKNSTVAALDTRKTISEPEVLVEVKHIFAI